MGSLSHITWNSIMSLSHSIALKKSKANSKQARKFSLIVTVPADGQYLTAISKNGEDQKIHDFVKISINKISDIISNSRWHLLRSDVTSSVTTLLCPSQPLPRLTSGSGGFALCWWFLTKYFDLLIKHLTILICFVFMFVCYMMTSW